MANSIATLPRLLSQKAEIFWSIFRSDHGSTLPECFVPHT